MIIFHDIAIEGFGSIGKKLKYRFSNTGLTVLRGKNGAGKTTIFSALMWGLKGKTLKEKSSVTTWENIQPVDYRGTRVKVYFEKDGTTIEHKHTKTFKEQKYLCINGPLEGQKHTIDSAAERGYAQYNRGSDYKELSKNPKCVLIYFNNKSNQ